MNRYNPYTVPENFFENTNNQAITKYRVRRRALRCGLAAMVLAATLITVPVLIDSNSGQVQDTEALANNLASMYDYDIFLQVNF